MTIIPNAIKAGLTFSTGLVATGFPAPDWTLKLHLRGPATIDLEATPDGDLSSFRAAGTATGEWTPGLYSYSLRATNDGGDVHEIEAGQVRILPDLAGDGVDLRSHARRTLDAIEAVIEKRASLDQERYRINNRELWRTPMADLIRLRNQYRAEVRRENAAKSGRLFGDRLKVRFTRA